MKSPTAQKVSKHFASVLIEIIISTCAEINYPNNNLVLRFGGIHVPP